MMMQIQEIGTIPYQVVCYVFVSIIVVTAIRTTEATNTDELEVFRSTTPCLQHK